MNKLQIVTKHIIKTIIILLTKLIIMSLININYSYSSYYLIVIELIILIMLFKSS